MSFRLSVLDQSPISEGFSMGDALRNTLDLAVHADRWGYHRYWLAEHHGMATLACASPEVMVGPVAAATRNLRVGTGGIMLPHYSPLKVAETFGMLSALYPGRVDLGIGRAAGTTPRVALALQRDRRSVMPDDFREQLDELIGLVASREESPELWLLGSSEQSAIWAAELGLPYAFADFINPAGASFARYYRARCEKPRVIVALSAICAETDEEAERLAASVRMMIMMLFRGRPVPVPPVEKALEFVAREGLPVGRRLIAGSPETVKRGIEAVAAEYGADEVSVVTITYDHAARLRSYELIAAAFGLELI